MLFLLSPFACLLNPGGGDPARLFSPETTTSQADLKLLDPELAAQQTSLPKLVLCRRPEPPARVRLPQLVIKGDEWRGVQCGVVDPRFAVFRHADKWESFWTKAMTPISSRLANVPSVDFDKFMVVGVFMGEKPDPHYEIEIRSIREENQPGRPQGPRRPLPQHHPHDRRFRSAVCRPALSHEARAGICRRGRLCPGEALESSFPEPRV